MKTTLTFLMVLILECLAFGQTPTIDGDCTLYDINRVAQDGVTNANGHINGYHYFGGQAAESCSYLSSSVPQVYCQTEAQVTPSVQTFDSGALTALIGFHVARYNTGDANGYNPNGGTSAQGVGAAAWVYCLSNNCSVSVVISGPGLSVTFPPSAVFTHSQNSNITCPAVADPQKCQQGGTGKPCSSPILIDTKGNGFSLTSAADGVSFDISGDGNPLKLAWTTAASGNAFLALDRNRDGLIDSGKELFGNYTEQPLSNKPNGYLALAEFDKPENGGNGDGIIDERDAVYSKLLLWIDENHDGISQPNELHTLREMGVYSIGLKYRPEPYMDVFGNWFRYRGMLNADPTDGRSKDGRWTYDVFLQTVEP